MNIIKNTFVQSIKTDELISFHNNIIEGLNKDNTCCFTKEKSDGSLIKIEGIIQNIEHIIVKEQTNNNYIHNMYVYVY